jgi:ABC-2 type transport system ATP-binding protein
MNETPDRAATAEAVPIFDVQALSKHYDSFVAVHPLTLQVGRGEVFGFLGPNGAGKTTTIRMLMGQLVPSGGRASLAGFDCHRQRAEVMAHVGYLPDVPVFYDYLRGREILQFVGEMHGLDAHEAHARTAQLLDEFALDEASEDFAVNYSLGMKKKLGLACALIHRPQALLLDEPTNGLDPRAAREVQMRLQRAAQEGTTIFLSTHLLHMAEQLCTRVGIIDHGRLVVVGTLDEVKQANVPGGSLEQVFLKVTDDDGYGAREPAHP